MSASHRASSANCRRSGGAWVLRGRHGGWDHQMLGVGPSGDQLGSLSLGRRQETERYSVCGRVGRQPIAAWDGGLGRWELG